MAEESRPMKTKLAAIEARANGMGPGPEFLQTKQALQEDIPWLVTELRAALERAEKAEALAEKFKGWYDREICVRSELDIKCDFALKKLKIQDDALNRIAMAQDCEHCSLLAIAAISAEATPLRSDAPSQPMGLEIARDGQAAGDLDAVDHRSAKGFMPAVFEYRLQPTQLNEGDR